jgi:hypothetical protein
MKLDQLSPSLNRLLKNLAKYQYALVGALVLSLFVYAVSIINDQLSPERDQAAYDAALSNIKTVKFNQEAVETIVRLKDVNVDVNAIFDPGRTNPFE